MKTAASRPREFTGRHMLAILVAFFGTVIAVNMVMFSFAKSSWTGLVVENSYVASQHFNEGLAAARKQEALGWSMDFAIADGRFRYRLTDKTGKPVAVRSASAIFRHPAYQGADWTTTLTPAADGLLTSADTPRDGIWSVEINADAGLDTPYRSTMRITIHDGVFK
ncbi:MULTISPECIES: FixH family protein [unclassified Rhizobium]|uniref:FixH family protein n=1 Tax=unclassified Rhizobium TaxID=2613769 RepID=UPI0006FBA8C3|nr:MULTISPECIES: FixH family protein [unclassified Rhizobium]KQV44357.1 cytochrome oxidase [Rhizobium sp. Root1212]KRD38538.1 cytochrome oxidase [Rhizobium sp. Root268]